jgi:diadenosine tetraphosphate (Ap4A) HIT family hydrolase
MRNRFSWITDASDARPSKIEDTVLAESKNFVAVPSLGSLVPGWTLVIPRRRASSLAEIPADELAEMCSFTRAIRLRLGSIGLPVFEFEHGAGLFGSLAGCGVDQAHLHLVPLEFDLVDRFESHRDVRDVQRIGASAPQPVPIGMEYLWCSDGALRSLMGRPARPTSQWFRRLIAHELSMEASWNYAEHPFENNIRKTIEFFE